MRRGGSAAHRGCITPRVEESSECIPCWPNSYAPERMAELHHEAERPSADPQHPPSPYPRTAARRGGGATGRDRRRIPPVDAAGARRTPSTLVGTLDHMLVGRRGISPVMIGRTTALSRLGRLVTGTAGERDDDLPAVALVAGEAGVGKTRLLRELVSSLPDGHDRCWSPKPSRARSAGRSTSSARCSATPRPIWSTPAPWRSTPWPRASATVGRW